MIRRLRRSFVTVTMLSAALVLVVLMGVVNLTNYAERISSDREILAYLVENGGRFPPTGGRGGEHGRSITAETPYETRFYTVLLNPEGQVIYADTAQVAAITREEAETTAQALYASGRDAGRTGIYRFAVIEYDGGDTQYVFLDCGRSIMAARAFLVNSMIVTAAGLLVLFFIARALSGRAVRPIVEGYEKQKSFITNAGHELKTPLAVIESSTEVVELEHGESQWTRAIHTQTKRLAALTEELVALARMDEGAARLTLEELDLSALAAETLEPYAMMAEQRGLPFETRLRPGLRVRADRAAAEKIITIMADNAVKYTTDGGAIRFTLSREAGRAVLRSENPAEGLSQGRQERFFDRFYRADDSRGGAPGYGLGLPLARSLAESMGGRMYAESPDGRRLVVTVRFG